MRGCKNNSSNSLDLQLLTPVLMLGHTYCDEVEDDDEADDDDDDDAILFRMILFNPFLCTDA